MAQFFPSLLTIVAEFFPGGIFPGKNFPILNFFPPCMLLDVYSGGVGYFYHLVVIFSTMIKIVVGVMSYRIFSHCEPFIGANTP